MRRVAAAKVVKRQPESDRAGPAVPPGRRSLHGQKIGRATPPRYRAGFGPPPRPRQGRALIRGGPAKQVKRAWEVADDLPEHIPVLPGELKVIETFLAAVGWKRACQTRGGIVKRGINTSWREPR
jgi:hypothetical protein